MHFNARNTNDLMWPVYDALAEHGVKQNSRNGEVVRLPGVTTMTLERPWERVNFCPLRDANPFFHYFEALMMLAAANDAKAHAAIVPNMMNYSDGGDTFNAYYGTRIREYDKIRGQLQRDQLAEVIKVLRNDPESRQAVVQIWDPEDLWNTKTKDKACNMSMVFEIVQSDLGQGVIVPTLNMTLFNRSNDAIWGTVSGANIFHFSMFHQYVSHALGVLMGSWTTVTNNLHVYTGNPQWGKLKKVYVGQDWSGLANPYDRFKTEPSQHILSHMQMGNISEVDNGFEKVADSTVRAAYCDLKLCVNTDWQQVPLPVSGRHDTAFLYALAAYKRGDKELAISTLETNNEIPKDLKHACISWLRRRK